MTRRSRIVLFAGAGLLGLAGLLVLAALLILPSEWFRGKVRDRIVSTLENASGGKVEIGQFLFDWKTLTAEVRPFVLRGTEPQGEAPLFRAESIRVALKVISMMKRDVDIQSVAVQSPSVNFLVDKNGITNLPEPNVKREKKNPIETILELAIRDFTVRDGLIHYGDKKIPVDLRGENLNASFAYDFTGPRYQGDVSMRRLHLDSGRTLPMAFNFDSKVTLERNRLLVDNAQLAMPKSRLQVTGGVSDFADPHAKFAVTIFGDLSELGKPLKIEQPYKGTISLEGEATYSAAESYQLKGKMAGTGLAIRQGRLNIGGIAVSSNVQLTPQDLIMTGVQLKALGGGFTGMVMVNGFRTYKVNGNVHDLSVRALAAAQGVRSVPWAGTVAGPVEVTATLRGNDLKAGGRLKISPARGSNPMQGFLDVGYDERRQIVNLGNSYVATGNTRLEFSGALGRMLAVKIESRDLNDLLPAIAMASPNAPKELPVKLQTGGSADFAGTVAGDLRNAKVDGQLTLTNFSVRGQDVDRLTATLDADRSGARVKTFAVADDTMRLAGSLDIGFQDWRVSDASPLNANVRLENARIKRLLTEAGQNLPVDGLLLVTAAVTGTVQDPRANINVTATDLTLYGERFSRFTGEVKYAGTGVEVINGVLEANGSRVRLAGAYQHPPADWKNGTLRFDVTSENLTLAQFRNVQQRRPGIAGQFDIKATGTADVRNGDPLLTNLAGQVRLRNLAVDKSPIGNFVIDAVTRGQQLAVAATGDLRGSKVSGEGEFLLAGDYPGKGRFEFSPLTFATIQDLVAATSSVTRPWPAEGVIAARLTFAGPMRKLDKITARAEIPTLQILPVQSAIRAPARTEKLTLQNQGPIVIEYDAGGVHIRNARLVGEATNLEVAGTANFNDRNPWNLTVNGEVNLAALRSFNADLVTSGAAVINASVRGSLRQPAIIGRLELRKASIYSLDFPNGLDNANGLILFDRNRATIEKLTGETGGGTLAVSGFVGYGVTPITYRMQVRAERVRIRYPEGVSSASDALLSITGTPDRSLLSGTITVRRLGFNPRTDVGGLLAASAKPIQTPSTPSPLLRNMHLDIRVETVPNLQFQASMTNDIQLEADLRVRGTAAKPAILGRVTINQGEIQFFGNKYTINRGEIGFFNPVKFEPVVDMDLETRVRGVVVNINFAGPINKLNFSYRSDPPLQSTEIIALLAVGRAPGSTSGLASSQTVTQNSIVSTGTNTLLGQAVAAPVSSRLQRFFGVSRLKIDPQLTDLDAIPQARLTLEQQISKDLTLTYITNLSKTNQQIVRLEWDLNRNWSLIAVREENGVFGMDFLYKKRFK